MNAPLETLVKTLGLPAALRLVERFGGTRVYLPRPEALGDAHPLVELIGVHAARELCELWPQERPYIPVAARFLRSERDRELFRDSNAHSVPYLARKYELTERQVYYILARGIDAEPDLAQRELF